MDLGWEKLAWFGLAFSIIYLGMIFYGYLIEKYKYRIRKFKNLLLFENSILNYNSIIKSDAFSLKYTSYLNKINTAHLKDLKKEFEFVENNKDFTLSKQNSGYLGSVEESMDVLTNGLQNAVKISNSHIPWSVVVLSACREGKLLLSDRTDILSSIKNVSLDAGSIAIGSLAGAKAGSAIGALGGPAGAVAGGVIGAFAGGLFGKSIGETIKTSDAEKAIELEGKTSQANIVSINESIYYLNQAKKEVFEQILKELSMGKESFLKQFESLESNNEINKNILKSELRDFFLKASEREQGKIIFYLPISIGKSLYKISMLKEISERGESFSDNLWEIAFFCDAGKEVSSSADVIINNHRDVYLKTIAKLEVLFEKWQDFESRLNLKLLDQFIDLEKTYSQKINSYFEQIYQAIDKAIVELEKLDQKENIMLFVNYKKKLLKMHEDIRMRMNSRSIS